MVSRLDKNKFSHQIQSWLGVKAILIVAVAAYLALAYTSPFSGPHFLYNVEPYPDALFYVNAARNIASQGEFIVRYEDFTHYPMVTPLYAYVLALGYLISNQPTMFYVVNVCLGALSLVAVLLTVRQVTARIWIVAMAAVIYLSHLILIWLPTVAIAENILVTIFSLALYSFFRYRNSGGVLNLGLVIVSIAALVFSKYTAIGPAGVLACGLLITTYQRKNWRDLYLSFGGLVLAGMLFFFSQLQIGYNPLFLLWDFQDKPVDQPVVVSSQIFYSRVYIVRNIVSYILSLLGHVSVSSRFLWLQLPLTSWGLVGCFLGGLGWLAYRQKWSALFFLALFGAQFPILSIFYVVDQRYIVLSVPILTVGLAYVLARVKTTSVVLAALCTSLFVQAWLQLPLLKSLVAANWLHSTVAWQYEAVLVFNQHLPSTSYLITVLPPLFVDLYATDQYQLLPMSHSQEFLDKGQYVWGDEIDYANLTKTYQNLLEQGEAVFVTNAYLSSQHEFQGEYETLQETFAMTKVTNGCLETCNLYQLGLKSAN